jgi:hypothetical protein
MKIEQKRYPTVKRFELGSKRIEVFDKSLNEELEYSIDYLELGNNILKKKGTQGRNAEIILLAFFGLEFGMLIYTLITEPNSNMIPFWALASAFFLGIYLLARFSRKKKLIYITGGSKSLELFQDKPNVELTNKFLNELQDRIKKAYKKEYLRFDDSTPFEAKKYQVDWLNRINILTDEESEDLIKEFTKEKSPNIGFGKGNKTP